MTFFSRQDIGRIYVIKMVLPDGQVVHKIGMTKTDRAKDRMMEILKSWFSYYRYVPYSELRMDMECGCPDKLEKHIHKILAGKRFIPHHKVNGGTEMFTGIDEFRVLHYLRSFNEELFNKPLLLGGADYKVLGKLISP